MRWGTAVAAIGLGTVFGSGWMIWEQRRENTEAAARTARSAETIPLMVQQDQGAMRLRWSAKVAGVRDASHGTLTITDGSHQSRLELDGRELRGGLASFWPDGPRVAFRLETDSGASGSIEAPLNTEPPPVPEAKATETDISPAPERHRPKPAAVSSHAKPIDDGLEWTRRPARRPKR
jgi:hypothetical protein